MSNLKVIVFFILCSPLFIFSQYAKRIAVWDLESSNISYDKIVTLSNRLRSEMVKTNKFTIIDRSELNKILKEQGIQQTGIVDISTAVRIGKIIGVRYILVGSVNRVGYTKAIDIRMIDVETSVIKKTASLDVDKDYDFLLNNLYKTG